MVLLATGAPSSVPSFGVTVTVMVSFFAKYRSERVSKPVPSRLVVPLTFQEKWIDTGSPSSSVVAPTVAVTVSPSAGLSGVRVTSAMSGGVLATVTAALVTGAPSSSPSFGVKVQAMAPPLANIAPSSVAVMTDVSAPSTLQAKV